jgi:hypothetical protein
LPLAEISVILFPLPYFGGRGTGRIHFIFKNSA